MITWTKNLTEVVKALNDLLKCPMPHDLLDIRKEVKEQYGGEDEDAKEDRQYPYRGQHLLIREELNREPSDERTDQPRGIDE